MKRIEVEFPFYGHKGYAETNLRGSLVSLLNAAQDQFTFSTFTTNATNFHSDGCIYVVKRGETARNRYSKNVIEYWAYGSSLPSVFANGCTQFDTAYIAAREFIRENCGI